MLDVLGLAREFSPIEADDAHVTMQMPRDSATQIPADTRHEHGALAL
jgi:hypothetical protein